MLPAQNRPRRSGFPSLKRFSGRSSSGLAMGWIAPVSRSREWKPERKATTRPPAARRTREPTVSGVGHRVSWPVAGSNRCTLQPLMSTQ